MKKIFTAGLIAVFIVGIVVFIIKVLVIDILPAIFGFLIVLFFDKSLIVPFSIAIVVVLIFILGFLTTRLDFRKIFNKIFLKRGVKNTQGALYKNDFAIIIKTINYKKEGKITQKYVIYRPFAPLPWSGFLSIAEKDEVILLNTSYLEILGIIASFGGNTPGLLEELEKLKTKSAD